MGSQGAGVGLKFTTPGKPVPMAQVDTLTGLSQGLSRGLSRCCMCNMAMSLQRHKLQLELQPQKREQQQHWMATTTRKSPDDEKGPK